MIMGLKNFFDNLRGKSHNSEHIAVKTSGDDDLIKDVRCVAIDTELTGLDIKKDFIVALGAIKMTGSRINPGENFFELVNPKSYLAGKNVTIHGITPSELIGKREIDDVLPDFLEFCDDDILIGFRPLIDIEFLNREMVRIFGVALSNPIVDIHFLHRWISQRQGKSHHEHSTLFDLAGAYGIPVKQAHDAIADAYVTAQIYQKMLMNLIELEITNSRDLLQIASLSSRDDRFRFSSNINKL